MHSELATSRSRGLDSDLLLVLGGNDEERHDSTEIVTRGGTCLLPEGFPAAMPEGRTGHVAVRVNKHVVVCGGLDRTRGMPSNKCWSFNAENNAWTALPGMKLAVAHAAAAAQDKHMLVLGGNDAKRQKTAAVQVTDHTRWSNHSMNHSVSQCAMSNYQNLISLSISGGLNSFTCLAPVTGQYSQ
jgi:hypothetical protein